MKKDYNDMKIFIRVGYIRGLIILVYFCNFNIFVDLSYSQEDEVYHCPKCHKKYRWVQSLRKHMKYECGKEKSFPCQYCPYVGRLKHHIISHLSRKHGVLVEK